MSVPGFCTSTYYFTYGPHGPGHGSGLRPRLLGGTLGTQGHVYAVVLQTELVDQSDIQGMFMLSHLWDKILFDSDASYSYLLLHHV